MNKKVEPNHRIRFKCNFCGKIFDRASECAIHIEKSSFFGLCFPNDIIVLYPQRGVDVSTMMRNRRLK